MIETFFNFLELGGSVLWVIFAVTLLLWTLIAERFYYLRVEAPKSLSEEKEKWLKRSQKSSWNSLRIREAKISQASMDLSENISLIKALVALCPLLGLLGTVTGMISVFDVMAVTGTGNTRSMASGISMATIPTMAGMVAALSGIYFGSLLDKAVTKHKDSFSEALKID